MNTLRDKQRRNDQAIAEEDGSNFSNSEKPEGSSDNKVEDRKVPQPMLPGMNYESLEGVESKAPFAVNPVHGNASSEQPEKASPN